jgi:hypothetical protein
LRCNGCCRQILWLIAQRYELQPGNTKGESIIIPLTSCLTGFDQSVLLIKTKIVSCHRADSKPVKQEVKGTVIIPPLVFPGYSHKSLIAPATVCMSEKQSNSIICILNYKKALEGFPRRARVSGGLYYKTFCTLPW